MIEFSVNGRPAKFNGDEQTPLLWVIRDHLRLLGTKFGCGIGQCGACSIHVDGRVQRSCMMPVADVAGRQVTTIEGLAQQAGSGLKLHPVQQAWIDHDVPQCGYCQAGQLMAASDLLARIPEPSDEDIDREMTNICRCGTYVRMRLAIHRAAKLTAEEN
jgi:isoquinoline 1-oxidoreductase alpha subunit